MEQQGVRVHLHGVALDSECDHVVYVAICRPAGHVVRRQQLATEHVDIAERSFTARRLRKRGVQIDHRSDL